MIWTIGAVVLALIMLVVLSKRVEKDDDPVWQTVVAVDGFCDEIARWESNLWSLWVVTVIENLLIRLDRSERILYLNKLENQIIELQEGEHKVGPMSEESDLFPYFLEKPDGSIVY